MTDKTTIALAGAGGDLGHRIAKALVAQGAEVLALVRPGLSDAERSRIAKSGANLALADPNDVDAMAAACAGASCVVSALNGVRDVMIFRQGVLLDAAIKAGVPRFIPSDYSADFTRTRPGQNRNFDLRREFMARVELAPIMATSVLNGAFMDMLGREMPIIQPRLRRVLYWHDADQLLDFTTKDDVAAYVAAVALDVSAPRILRIAGDACEPGVAPGERLGDRRPRTLRTDRGRSRNPCLWNRPLSEGTPRRTGISPPFEVPPSPDPPAAPAGDQEGYERIQGVRGRRRRLGSHALTAIDASTARRCESTRLNRSWANPSTE